MKRHKKPEQKACSGCNDKCTQGRDLSRHKNLGHGDTCSLCKNTFIRRNKLKKHIELKHQQNCNQCDDKAHKRSSLKKHITLGHENTCDQCRNDLLQKSRLKDHIRSNRKEDLLFKNQTLCAIAFVLNIELAVEDINGERQEAKEDLPKEDQEFRKRNRKSPRKPKMDDKATFLEVIEKTGLALNNAREKKNVEEEIVEYQLKLLRRRLNPVVQQNVEHLYISPQQSIMW